MLFLPSSRKMITESWQNRSASSYYRDEGWSDDDPPTYEPYGGGVVEKHPEWIEDTPSWGTVFDTLAEADAYAHSEYSEYGVSYGFEVERTVTEVAAAVPVEETKP